VLCGILFVWVMVSLYIFGKDDDKNEEKEKKKLKEIKNTFYNRVKYHRRYYHEPWKLTMLFISVFTFGVYLLWVLGVFPIQLGNNANNFLSDIAIISATIFIILFTLLVLTVQISVQRYTLDFHRRILLNGWFLIYTGLFIFSIFFPLYADGINRSSKEVTTFSFVLMAFCIILIIPLFSWAMKKTFMSRHLGEEYGRLLYNLATNNQEWVRWQFQELCSISLLSIKNNSWTVFTDGVGYMWKAWLKIDDEPVKDDFSVKERMIIFWKKIIESEDEFIEKFLDIGKKSFIEKLQVPKDRIEIFKEFRRIADSKNKEEISKKCKSIYEELDKNANV